MSYIQAVNIIKGVSEAVNPDGIFVHGRTWDASLEFSNLDIQIYLYPFTGNVDVNNSYYETYQITMGFYFQDTQDSTNEDRQALIQRADNLTRNFLNTLNVVEGVEVSGSRVEPSYRQMAGTYTGYILSFTLGIDTNTCGGEVEPDIPTLETFCEKVDDCLNIPEEDGNYMLKILEGVKSWVTASASATWGSITGTLSDQTDLNTALSNKANASDLTAHTSNTSNPHSVTATQVDALKRDGSNANSDIDLGAYKLNAQSLGVKGVNGAGHVGLKHQASNATASANETSLFAGSDGELYYKNDGNSVVQIATRAWVTAQGYITNVITALGYTPENVANKTTTIAGNESSTTLYANVKGLVDWVKQGMTALLSSSGLTKTTPVDADSLLLNDSADSNKLKLLSWANLKSTLKTYFDTLYNGQINPITQFSSFTHFTEIFPGIGAGTTGAGVWELGNGWVLARNSSGASATVLPAESGRHGIVRHSTGATSSYNQIRCGSIWVSSAPLLFKGHFRIQTLSGGGQTFVITCGFQTGGTLVAPTDAIRIFLTDAKVLQVEVIKSSVSLVVNTGITVAIDTHYDIVITKAETSNECQFYVNGVNVYSLTNSSDIATYVPQNLSMECHNSFLKVNGATARTFDTDYAYVTNNIAL